MNSFNNKKHTLLRVIRERLIISDCISNDIITSEDIISLFQNDTNYGFNQVDTYKEQMLKNIYNSPFLLCDQNILEDDVKERLPEILRNRYKNELEELKYLRKLGVISKEEEKEQKDFIKFCYYYTSEEGKYILRRGHMPKNENKVLKLENL